jgi:lysophospholipase L1-like esterase
VRTALQKRFGVGGPGFVHIGLKGYHHSQVKTETLGKWQRFPTSPARTTPFLDGIFGLAGQRTVAEHRALFRATLKPGVLLGKARWEVQFRLTRGASFRLTLGDTQKDLREKDMPADRDPSELMRVSIEGDPSAVLELRQLSGLVEFFGLVVEGSGPGVVLDTLGIDGARAKTPLAWQKESWQRELARRSPDLVVLAYGTNEVFETREAEAYLGFFQELVGRVRTAAPDSACLLVGPTDVMQPRGESHERVQSISSVQRRTAESLGCAYVGAHSLMGGQRSYAAWSQAKPRLAGSDGVHLTVSGYRELGSRTARFLLEGYEDRVMLSNAPPAPR